MILCVDKNAIQNCAGIQKDIDLEDIVNNHTKYYENEDEAFKDNHVPLGFCISIRSVYSNKVVQYPSSEGRSKYYTNLLITHPFPHKGYDLIMYMSSIGVIQSVQYVDGFDELMFKYSKFLPIGFYNPDPDLITPLIYTHIIIDDEVIEELSKCLKEGIELVPISDMKEEGNLPALLDTLIVLKEESNNVNDND